VALLRAHVVRRAEDGAAVGEVEHERQVLGEAEVDQGDAAVVAQHDVAGLEIPMQHSRAVDGGERASDRGREPQRLSRCERRAHPPAQIAELEVLHHEPRMLVADPEVMQAHHRRAVDALGELVLLQEALEHVDGLALLVLAVARDLERHQPPGALALADEEIARGARRQAADEAIAADEGVAEALGLASRAAAAPDGPGQRLTLLRRHQHLREGVPLELLAAQGVGPERARLARRREVRVGEQHERRKAGAARELARPVEATATGPGVRQQHRIETLGQELRRQRSLRDGAVHGELRLRPP